MNIPILSSLESLPYFSIEAVRQLLGDIASADGSIRTALYRWMKSGHIIRLKKGVYMTSHFYEFHRGDADFASAVSAILIPQSYLSLEYILQRHAILTEVTYPISAVTLKHTRVIENKLGTFTYRNIKEPLYTGYVLSDYLGIPFSQASVAKALFDYLYLHSRNPGSQLSGNTFFEDLRLNLEDFSEAEQTEFAGYVEMSQSRKMDKILGSLRKSIWRH